MDRETPEVLLEKSLMVAQEALTAEDWEAEQALPTAVVEAEGILVEAVAGILTGPLPEAVEVEAVVLSVARQRYKPLVMARQPLIIQTLTISALRAQGEARPQVLTVR